MTPVWWLLIFVPALLALYFLKLKRQSVEVSSTLLWKRCLEDLHVNSPFQRLRRSLLFLLQLLVISALILAVWRPRCRSVDTPGGNLLVFVDVSASMNAREDGETRLDRAKDDALKLLDSLKSGDRMMVVTFATRAVTLQRFTSDRAILESQIRSIRPTSLPTDLARTLSTAHALAESLPTAEVYFLGDGCYGDLAGLPEEAKRLRLHFMGKAQDADNVGITTADVGRTFGAKPRTEISAVVQSFAREERQLTLTLFHEDVPVDAREVTVPAGETLPVIFDVSELAPGMVRLAIDGTDALPDDDQVYLEISEPRQTSVVVVGEENEWLDWALASSSRVAYRRVSRSEFASDAIQEELRAASSPVIIYDRWVPEEIPRFPALFIGCHPPFPEGVPPPQTVEAPLIIDHDYSHPINRFLAYRSMRVKKSLVFEAAENYHSLVDAEKGSVIGVLTRELEDGSASPAVLIGFNLLESRWPVSHHSFPIFFTNALAWLGLRYSDEKSRWRTGEPLVYAFSRGDERADGSSDGYEIRAPDGSTHRAERESDGAVVFGGSDAVGVYDLRQGADVVARFGVALLSEAESNLRPLPDIDLGDVRVEISAGLTEQSRDLWMWIALAALGIMILEWFIYHRRVYV